MGVGVPGVGGVLRMAGIRGTRRTRATRTQMAAGGLGGSGMLEVLVRNKNVPYLYQQYSNHETVIFSPGMGYFVFCPGTGCNI